jgi:hypothetical protein
MFALEDRPFVRFFPFPALFPGSHTSPTSARPRLASSLTAGAYLAHCPRIRDDNRYSPATLPLLPLPNKAASPRQHRLSPTKARTMNTLTHDATKPFRMRTYTEMGEGVSHLNRHGKIRRGSKLLGMIFLHKKRNNFFGMKLFQKKGEGGGVPSRLT